MHAVKAFYLDQPTEFVDSSYLEQKLGVLYWHLTSATNTRGIQINGNENDEALNKICRDRGYDFKDIVDSTTIPDLHSKLDTFLVEHLHDDDEIRYFLAGSGYFDVRDLGDARWIRIHCQAGDLILLPAGIYHRFVPDQKLFFRVMRLFSGAPVWTAFARDDSNTEKRVARLRYAQSATMLWNR